MTWYTFLPLAVMLVLSAVLGRIPLPLHPSWSARLLATTAATTTVTALGTGVFVSINYAAAPFAPEWTLFASDRPIPDAAGVPAVLLTIAGLLITGRTAVHWMSELRTAQAQTGAPLDTDVPIAVAVPGRRGGVLLSRGMLSAFTSDELHVVLQHETSHLRHRHHRYTASGALLAATLPPLRPLNTRLRLAVERWADEDTAEAVNDRTLVARTIAKAALAHSPPAETTPAFADSGVVQRVEALLTTPPGRNAVTGPLLCMGNGFITGSLTATTLQLDQALLPLLALL